MSGEADTRADGVRVAYPLFHEGGSGAIPTSALQLWFRVTELPRAIELNRLWHSRLPKLPAPSVLRTTNHVAYVAEYEGVFYAAAIWSSPVAAKLPQDSWLELRRLAIALDAPKNTASRMLAWMVRDLRVRFPAVVRLVSYQGCDAHKGTIYKAAGWNPAPVSKGRPWRSNMRHRSGQHVVRKVRWEKVIREGRDA